VLEINSKISPQVQVKVKILKWDQTLDKGWQASL
jgi:hypothetical protein